MADEKPPVRKRNRSTKARQALLAAGRGDPNDPLDKEVNDAIAEGRPVDMEAAFPNPPPPLAPVRKRTRADAATSQKHRAGAGHIPVAVAVPAGEENTPETRAKQAARAGLTDTGTVMLVDEDGDPIPVIPDARSTPAERLKSMTVAGNYQTEYKLRLLHRLLMRGLPIDIIAGQMQLSIPTVKSLRAQLYRRLAVEAAATFDMNLYVGKSEAFYNELRGLSMRMVDDNGKKDAEGKWIEPPPTRDQKMRAIHTALSVEADRHRFYSLTGVFQAMPFRPDALTGDSQQTDNASRIIDLVQAVITGDVDASYALPEEDDTDDASLLG